MAKDKSKAEQPESFEAALSDLADIVSNLEAGSVGLEESLAQFEQGMALLRHCRQVLTEAELRIEQLTGFDCDGNEVTAPFEATSTIEQQNEAPGRRKRGKRERSPTADAAEEDEGTDIGPRLF